MRPEQRTFIDERLMEEVESLVKRKATGPWWRRLLHRLHCFWNVWECIDTEIVRVPRTCDRCDSEDPVAVLGFTEVPVYECTISGAEPTRRKLMLLVGCATCGMMQVLDPVPLGIVDEHGNILGKKS